MEEACRREGHPDNVAACVNGYLTVSTVVVNDEGSSVAAATTRQATPWKLLLALPSSSLATEKARALLPPEYNRPDVVANLQLTALLVAAFAQGRGDLLRVAMQDRLHQPYRMQACPLLPLLLPLAGEDGILGVASSAARAPPFWWWPHHHNATEAVAARDPPGSAADPSLEILETAVIRSRRDHLLTAGGGYFSHYKIFFTLRCTLHNMSACAVLGRACYAAR